METQVLHHKNIRNMINIRRSIIIHIKNYDAMTCNLPVLSNTLSERIIAMKFNTYKDDKKHCDPKYIPFLWSIVHCTDVSEVTEKHEKLNAHTIHTLCFYILHQSQCN